MMVEIKASMRHRFADPLPCGSVNSDLLPAGLREVVEHLSSRLRHGESVVDAWGAADEPMDEAQWAVMFCEDNVTFGFTGSSWSLNGDAQKLVQYLDENLPKTPRNDALKLFNEMKEGMDNK
jgi:hypothetical protein